jgi:hypothetical protein
MRFRLILITIIILLFSQSALAAQLAHIEEVQIGERHIIRILTNAPQAFRVLENSNCQNLVIKLYGVELGNVESFQMLQIGNLNINHDGKGNLVLSFNINIVATNCKIANGRSPNIIEIIFE